MADDLKEICNRCGKCCHQRAEVSMEDIDRIAKALNRTREDVLDRYITFSMKQGEDGACVLLRSDHQCTTYDQRPEACRQHLCDTARGVKP